MDRERKKTSLREMRKTGHTLYTCNSIILVPKNGKVEVRERERARIGERGKEGSRHKCIFLSTRHCIPIKTNLWKVRE